MCTRRVRLWSDLVGPADQPPPTLPAFLPRRPSSPRGLQLHAGASHEFKARRSTMSPTIRWTRFQKAFAFGHTSGRRRVDERSRRRFQRELKDFREPVGSDRRHVRTRSPCRCRRGDDLPRPARGRANLPAQTKGQIGGVEQQQGARRGTAGARIGDRDLAEMPDASQVLIAVRRGCCRRRAPAPPSSAPRIDAVERDQLIRRPGHSDVVGAEPLGNSFDIPVRPRALFALAKQLADRVVLLANRLLGVDGDD